MPFVGRTIGNTKPIIGQNTQRVVPVPFRSPSHAQSAATPQQIIQSLSVAGSSVALTNAGIQTFATNSSATDEIIAIGQAAATTILAASLFTAVAPEAIAAASIAGIAFAVAAVGNDAYKLIAASGAITAASDPDSLAQAQKNQSAATDGLGVDVMGLILAPLGVPAEAAGTLGLGESVIQALTEANSGAQGVVVQGLSLITGITGLAVAANGTEFSTDSQTSRESNLEVASLDNELGVVDGQVGVSNSNGPILSPLSGVVLTEPNTNTQFTTLGGVDDN